MTTDTDDQRESSYPAAARNRTWYARLAYIEQLLSQNEKLATDRDNWRHAAQTHLQWAKDYEQRATAAEADRQRLADECERLRGLLEHIQETSSKLSNSEGEVADFDDDGGQDDDPERIRLTGVMYKLRRELSREIFASRAVTAALAARPDGAETKPNV